MESLTAKETELRENPPTIWRWSINTQRANVGVEKVSELKFGAGDGDRTRNIQLGKVT